MNDIDVVVPTLRRPDDLARALRSVFAQAGVSDLVASIVVVDNSPEGSAVATLKALRPVCPVPLVFVHEPKPGVATARNAGLAASHARFIAFLDDDEEAPPHWLGALRDAHTALGSAVTFGPVHGLALGAAPGLRAYFDRFFSRLGRAETVLIEDQFGCGNSMMTRAVALHGPKPFDVSTDVTGGEDDRLFTRLRVEGATFGWAADAWVREYAPAHRTTAKYVLKRAFCFGQAPSQIAWQTRRLGALALCMVIGTGQASVYGATGLVLLGLGRRATALGLLDRAARGVGKMFWVFPIPLYGLAGLPTGDAPERSPGGVAQPGREPLLHA